MARKRGQHGGRGRWAALTAIVWAIFFFSFFPEAALAIDGLTGYMNLQYVQSDSKLKDAQGNVTESETRALLQLYNLTLDKNLWPNLRLQASGQLQKNASDVTSDSARTTSTTTITRPYIDLTLGTPLYTIGGNFTSVKTEINVTGAPKLTVTNDAYNGILAWKPVDLPSLEVLLSRTHSYDEAHTSQDTVGTQVALYSRYEPVKNLLFRYQGNWTDTDDRIHGVETKSVAHDIRTDYASSFFKNRVSVAAYYDLGLNTTDVITGGQGTVSFLQPAFSGLYIASTSPNNVKLLPAAFLINNDVVESGNTTINIGSGTFPADTTPRNIGLGFGNVTEITMLSLWVNSVTDFLPQAVAGAFAFAVWISSDNQNWSLYQTISPDPNLYKIDPTHAAVGHFDIPFPDVKTQYIKVVVTPLTPAAAGGQAALFPNIYVTELQAFVTKPAAALKGTTSGTSQTASLYTKVQLLNRPYLFYDFSYFSFQSEALSFVERRTTISNALSLTQQLSSVFSGSARVGRVDDTLPAPAGHTVSYDASVSLHAVPLPTLSHTLSLTGTVRESPTGRSTTQAAFLANTAELYRGVSMYLNGGLSSAESELHVRTSSSQYSLGLSMTPMRSLSVTLGYSYTETETQGNGSSFIKSENVAVSYNPFTTLYLFGSWSEIEQPARRDRITNYGLSWSPFPGGALRFSFSYSESLLSQDNSRSRVVQPSVTWYMTRWAYLQGVYNLNETSSDLGDSTTTTYSALLRLTI